MQQALELARQGMALASPNPCVGAVLVEPGARSSVAALILMRAENMPRCWRWKQPASAHVAPPSM